MAACVMCGGKAGAFKEICKSCESAKQAQQRAERAEAERAHAEQREQQRIKAAQELEARTVAFIEESLQSFHRTLDQGRTPYLYSMIGVTVPYSLLEQPGGAPPDLHDLAALGRDGWEIVATLPQTAGIGLQNVYNQSGGKTWAGGIGGIVTGAYLLIRLPVTEATLRDQDAMLRAALRSGYEDSRSFTSPQVLVPGVEAGKERSGISPLAGVAMGALGVSVMLDAAQDMGIIGDGGGDGGGDFDGEGFDF